MTPSSRSKNILIIAGEPSGDVHAGKVLNELNQLLPDTHLWGVGGDKMESAGVELIAHIKDFSIVGVWEAIKSLPRIRRQFKTVTDAISERKPDMAILVDYPGFNLRIARHLKGLNIPVIYYIVPQFWAWGRGRIKLLKRFVSKALVLFKFEEELLLEHDIDCEFVGHPLMDDTPEIQSVSDEEKSSFNIALLPGSRKSEIENMFPVFLETAEKIHRSRKDVSFILARNSNIENSLYDSYLEKHKDLRISDITDTTFSVLERSDFALITSGTATLEAAAMETPMIIAYRAAFLTNLLYNVFSLTRFIGLPNIIAGKEIVPEMLQKNAVPDLLAHKTLEIINDVSKFHYIKEELLNVKNSLGPKGAGKRAAESIQSFFNEIPIA